MEKTPPNSRFTKKIHQPLAPYLDAGRAFVSSRKVRLGDASPKGRLRLDALTRYTQDASNDDTTDAGLSDDPGWVVRSTTVDELVPASYGETLTFTTFCSGLGKRWADRRLSISGDRGARYEVCTLWVCVDHETGAPQLLNQEFLAIYAEAAGGRAASARQRNPKLKTTPPERLTDEIWQLRKADFDTLGHVNNAAYWCAVEQWLAEGPPITRRARIEYGTGLGPADSVRIARSLVADEPAPPTLAMWWIQNDQTAATATVAAIDPEIYSAAT